MNNPARLDTVLKEEVVKRCLGGESASMLSREYNVSRDSIYRWISIYNKGLSLDNNYATGDKNPRTVYPKYESIVTQHIIDNPNLTVHQIAEKLPISSWTVWQILKRNNLNNYDKRLQYISKYKNSNQKILGIFSITSLVFILVGLYLFNYMRYIFASSALFMGMIFFLYSLKYYLSLFFVLSYSQDAKSKSKGLISNLENYNLTEKPFISIHVAVFNEDNVIERLMKAVTSFDYPNYEIILADDSTDGTIDTIHNFQAKHLFRGEKLNTIIYQGYTLTQVEVRPGLILKHIHRDNRSGFKGAALSIALKHTNPNAKYVSIFDADFVPYPDTLELFLKYFQVSNSDSNIAAVQGYQWHVLNKSENWITRGVRSEYSGSYVVERSGAEIYGGLKQISGSVYMIKKDALEEVGWGTSITEDFELTLKLYEKGYKVLYTPYIQAPAECVSTLKRLIRQRMRWAEGHSLNVRAMFLRLMTSKNLTIPEKIEFIYLSPYYLQAFFFLVGTFSWIFSEVVFKVELPFWTEVWGWSLILTNMISLPLVNGVGMFLEESETKDFSGLASFVALSYILVPFQAYASVKGFLEIDQGGWFRTPKTGRITDIFTRGRLTRFIQEIIPKSPYLAMTTANNKFDDFKIIPKNYKKIGHLMTVLLLLVTTSLLYYMPFIRVYDPPNVLASGLINTNSNIQIIDIHSHPKKGDNWSVRFKTKGAGSLKITPNDEKTQNDIQFVSLLCGEKEMGGSDWECNTEAIVTNKIIVQGDHALKFEFRGETAFAFNGSPTTSTSSLATANSFQRKTWEEDTPSANLAISSPLEVSASNARYFADGSGNIVPLNGSHTWRNFQNIDTTYPPGDDEFGYTAYLDFLAQNNLNYMRLWSWETSKDPAGYDGYYVAPMPYARTGPGNAHDGQLKFDLDTFDQDYFDRMYAYVSEAKDKGIYVSIQLFNGFSVGIKNGGPNPWDDHPFDSANNINSVDGDVDNDGEGFEIQTLANSSITARQEAYVEKVIDTVNDLPNVLYEIANEAEGDASTLAWENHLVDHIHTYESGKTYQHPVGMSALYPGGSNSDLFASNAEFIAPNATDTGGYSYDTAPRPNTGSSAIVISDTDHVYGLGGDRKWFWRNFMRGLNSTYMDCYIEDALGCPIAETDAGRISLLANNGYIRNYANRINLELMTPSESVSSTTYALAYGTNPNNEYLAYQPGTGAFNMTVTADDYYYEWFNPATGRIVESGTVTGTGSSQSFTPPFSGDAVLYLKSTDDTSGFARQWAAVYSGSEIQFWYTQNNGNNWTQNTNATISVSTNDFSIWGDLIHTYIAYTSGFDVVVRRASLYPSTKFYWGSASTAFDGTSGTDYYNYPTIAEDTNGEVWVMASRNNSGTYTINARRSTNANDVSAWDTASSLDSSANSNKYGIIVPRASASAYAIWIDNATIEGKNYNGTSWDGSPTSINTGLTGFADSFSAVSDGGGNVYLTFVDDESTDQISATKYNGTSWSTAVLVADSADANDSYPTLSADTSGGDLYAFWIDTSTSDIYYSVCDASTNCDAASEWSSETAWKTSDVNTWITSNYSTFGKIFATWTTGSGSPYTANWDYVIVPEYSWLFFMFGPILPLITRLKKKNKYGTKENI